MQTVTKTRRNRIQKVSSPIKSKKKISDNVDKKPSRSSKLVSSSKGKTKTKSKSKNKSSPKKTETTIPAIK